MMVQYLNTISKNNVISTVRKRYCALGLGLGLAEIPFRSNVFRASVIEPEMIV